MEACRYYSSLMTEPDFCDAVTGAAMLGAAGVNVTEEGEAEWRQRLRAADAHWTPERHAALRRQVGLQAA